MSRGPALEPTTVRAAAEAVPRRHGTEKAAVPDVARTFGVSHGTVSRYFPAEQAQWETVVADWLARRDGRLPGHRDGCAEAAAGLADGAVRR
ncbi:hypothetical protein Shyhy01_21610 [Streptomyces hygroscopicus subsp. hygroscopicus]|uniref:TetR family transcriptional regulator n=1 Tax=Streptomyces sp. KHY 26 TaxID=3097359 RepID=UPI0024A5DCBF|nr:TetR family transcriptional regulator [Streptomyces hygroscopicus]GLX49211.1 hypothetical protein Shyhy01_21610 [Streptomyces hygroscopicus subsp. hygroscopicus]